MARCHVVSHVVGFIKGKSAIHLARTYGERKRNFVGQSFWARGFFVSTEASQLRVFLLAFSASYHFEAEAPLRRTRRGTGLDFRHKRVIEGHLPSHFIRENDRVAEVLCG